MPRYVLDAAEDPEAGVVVPSIYASLLPWAREEYERSGDPRWYRNHPDGKGGRCHGPGCGHGPPPPETSPYRSIPRRRRVEALEAGEPVVVTTWIASGRRWRRGKGGWSKACFELPWDPKKVRQVRVSADDRVVPA